VAGADRVIRWSPAVAVVGVAAVAAVASYEHASALVRAHGESGWSGQLIPLTVDGLIYASSMAMLDSARRGIPAPTRCDQLTARLEFLPGNRYSLERDKDTVVGPSAADRDPPRV
jgi:hypothetical protein